MKSRFMDSIKVIKNRSDLGAGIRGSDLGIDAIEIAAINAKNDYFNRFEEENVETENDAIYDKQNNPFAKRISKVLITCERQCDAIKGTLIDHKFPLALSGDHSIALGTISGIKAAFPEKKLGVIWIDAHADLHSPYTSPSGNIHGMPLAAALGTDNMEHQINNVLEQTEIIWKKLKNICDIQPKILPSDLIYFSIRDTEESEDSYIEKNEIKNYSVKELRHRGINACVSEAVNKISDCEMIYISFDVDSMDCELISKGTGTPVSNGLDQYEVIDIVKEVLKSKKVVFFEVVEVNPTLDNKGNKMAETAFEVLDQITPSIKKYCLNQQ